MFNYFKIAWRNLWRNKRRTYITASSILFAVFFALIMRAFQLGSYEHMVHNIVHSFTGYFQLQGKDYWEEKTINNAIEITEELERSLSSINGIDYSSRIESYVLVSHKKQTKGAILQGVNVDDEDKLTGLKDKLYKGEFFNNYEAGVMISNKLSEFLKINVGDTLVILSQGYQGSSAAGAYPVTGILKFSSPELDKQMVFLSLYQAQEFLSAYDMVTAIAFNLHNPRQSQKIINEIKMLVDSSLYKVMDWQEMMPEMVQQIEGDNASGLIMLGILYMIVGFGIIGTVLMMTSERAREFGVMIAIGMNRLKLIVIQLIEMFYIGIIGVLSGIIISLPILYYFIINPIRLTGNMAKAMEDFGFEPIIPAIVEPGYFISQTMVIIIIVIIASFIPAISILRLSIINALKNK